MLDKCKDCGDLIDIDIGRDEAMAEHKRSGCPRPGWKPERLFVNERLPPDADETAKRTVLSLAIEHTRQILQVAVQLEEEQPLREEPLRSAMQDYITRLRLAADVLTAP